MLVFRKVFLLYVMPVCVSVLMLTTGGSALENKKQSSATYNNLMNQMQVFNKVLNSSNDTVQKEDHKLYYRSAKDAWPSSVHGSEPYPYDEPYYSQHKDIAITERTCISELVDLQAIAMKNTLSSI